MISRRRPDDAGFTLLEVLVVIAILGLLIGLVAPAALRQLGGAKVSTAKLSIQSTGNLLEQYKLDVGRFPTGEEGLQALVSAPSGVAGWNGPYIKPAKVPLDAWNHQYSYRVPSSRPGHDFDLCSPGPNGTGGSEEICNP